MNITLQQKPGRRERRIYDYVSDPTKLRSFLSRLLGLSLIRVVVRRKKEVARLKREIVGLIREED